MKVIAISGKARHGKDYSAEVIEKLLVQKGHKVLVTHYADLLKYLCKSLFNWNGQKDENGRHLLQYVGTDVVRKKRPDFWVDFIIDILDLFEDEWDYVLIPDCRFPNEIIRLQQEFETISVRIHRPDFDSGLSEEAKNHVSETALDDFEFDFTIINNGDDTFVDEISKFIESI